MRPKFGIPSEGRGQPENGTKIVRVLLFDGCVLIEVRLINGQYVGRIPGTDIFSARERHRMDAARGCANVFQRKCNVGVRAISKLSPCVWFADYNRKS